MDVKPWELTSDELECMDDGDTAQHYREHLEAMDAEMAALRLALQIAEERSDDLAGTVETWLDEARQRIAGTRKKGSKSRPQNIKVLLTFTCSCGHEWTAEHASTCPACGEPWSLLPKPPVNTAPRSAIHGPPDHFWMRCAAGHEWTGKQCSTEDKCPTCGEIWASVRAVRVASGGGGGGGVIASAMHHVASGAIVPLCQVCQKPFSGAPDDVACHGCASSHPLFRAGK